MPGGNPETVPPGLSPDQAERGAGATSPLHYGWRAWRDILKRVWINTSTHNISFLAAGVAFFGFLSLAPALALIIMVYGLVADPSTIFANMVDLIRVVPAKAAMLINDQLSNLIRTAAKTHGLAVVPAVFIALYGASGAARGIISSLNTIYEEAERRNIFKLTLVSMAIAVAAVTIAFLGLISASAAALLQKASAGLRTELSGPAVFAIRGATWLIAGALATLVITLVYRFGPSRAQASWRWLTLGSALATVLWLLGSLGFGWYLSLASYDITYGSLGAVMALIMWMYVSAYALLLGAFFDAETERQTAHDSTTGRPRPMGKRGAVVADTSAAMDAK